MTVLTPTPKMQFVDASGVPLANGLLYTYNAGTTTPQATYTDSSGATPNTNPIVLNARGEANVWLGSATYKFKLCDPDNTEIWTVDNISAPTSALSPVLSGNVVIDSSSSGPALTITQSGTGPNLKINAPNPFAINTNGFVGIGTLSPATNLDVWAGTIQISSASGTAYTAMSATATDSIFNSVGSRNLVLQTNGVARATINATASTFTVPVVLPGVPTSALQAATKSYVDLGSPAGIIAPFAGTAAPAGWLACQGQVVSQTTYAALFAAIGATWNTGGEGAGNFRLPDLRGIFLRGTGTNGTGSSSGAVGPSVGGYATDTYLNHSHTATDSGHQHNYLVPNTSGVPTLNGGSGYELQSAATTTGYANITVALSTTGGTETKPKNYGILYIIKT